MFWDNRLRSEPEHWIFLRLPKPMKQGHTYTVRIPSGSGSDTAQASLRFDIWNSFSEAVHVNIIGHPTTQKQMATDLYLWLSAAGPRKDRRRPV